MGQFESAAAQLKQILPQYFVTSVTRYPVVKFVDNSTGDEGFTYSATNTLLVYIVRRNTQWLFDKSGLIQGGDALMLVRYGDTIVKNDKIAWNGNNYRVQAVLNRDQYAGINSYIACNLFLI